jgi:hypothetical protein
MSESEGAMAKRVSISSTYDSLHDGLQYAIGTTVNGESIGSREIPDPFLTHTVRVSLRDTIRGLLRGGVVVCVSISGTNPRIVEDVLELDDQYLGQSATRRDEFTKGMLGA